MSGLLLIGVLIIWFVTAVSIALMLTSRLKNLWIKMAVSILVIAALTLLPIADEVIGKFQFDKLCSHYAVQYIDENNALNKKVFYVPLEKGNFAKGTAVPIKINPEVYKDVDTGKILVSSHTLIASGGWLIRTLGISETNSPLLFNRACYPPNQDKFKKKFNILVIN